ncbi:MAG: ATP-binding protein [Candidatus Saccharimonadales bacterium]
MFQSATLKLTGWYLLILMTLSLLFSVAIYQIASSEINARLSQIETSLRLPRNYGFPDLRSDQLHEGEGNLVIGLVYINFLVLGIGGVGSFYLARRTIRPIEEAHEAQSRFTSDASHELRTPLAAMKTEIEVALRDTHLTKDEMHELLESNLEEVNKLTRLSHTLLQLSKLDYSNVEREKVEVNRAVTNVIKTFDPQGKRIHFKEFESPIYTMVTLGSVEELAMILIDNAIKYSPDTSMVSVTVTRRSGKVRIEVSNEGSGIPEEQLPHIFDRFYRGDSSRTNASKNGYGLGLSVAKKIVELNDGELTATSAVNDTTIFTIILQTSSAPSKSVEGKS